MAASTRLRLPLGTALAAVLLSTACQAPAAEARSLEGTAWELVSIESMDDEQGVTTVPDPSAFTMEFGPDGQAFFQLDCNRGHGSYTAEPSEDGTSGGLQFGPIATTMMLCPQPSLDQQVSSALPHVRSYLFQDDQLHLSKWADGGILHWRQTTPTATAPAPTPEPSPAG